LQYFLAQEGPGTVVKSAIEKSQEVMLGKRRKRRASMDLYEGALEHVTFRFEDGR
jgi:hypothetical protein